MFEKSMLPVKESNDCIRIGDVSIPMELIANSIEAKAYQQAAQEETARAYSPFTQSGPNVIYNNGTININSNNKTDDTAMIIGIAVLFIGLFGIFVKK